jgi:hypothetical protein
MEFVGEHEVQRGPWRAPAKSKRGKLVTVTNEPAGESRLYVYQRGQWHYVTLG